MAGSFGMALDSARAAEGSYQSLGTLSCLAGVPEENDRQRPLDCTFKPLDGVSSRLRGEIAQIGGAPHPVAKRVLVWQVFGPAGLEPGELAGTYVRRDPPLKAKPQSLANALVGGTGDAIALQPPSGREQIPGNDAVTVLELSLAALKT